MKNIVSLLKDVDAFVNRKEVTIGNSEEAFNMFRICGVDHYENSHSSIIAAILDTNGSHGLKHRFLEALLQVLKSEGLLETDFEFSLYQVSIKCESAFADGRLDILLRNSDNQGLLIENKIYALDQFKQLKRYYDYGKQEFKDNFKLLYLTLWGTESADTDKTQVDYIQVSYRDTIVKWLDRCIEIAARKPVVRETLIQYLNHIKYLTNQNISATMNNELIEVLSKKDNLKSAFEIAENIDRVKNNIINTHLLPQLKDVASTLNLSFITVEGDFVNTSWAGFQFVNSEYENYSFFIEFGAKGLRNAIIGFVPKKDHESAEVLPALKKITGGGNKRCAFKKFPLYVNWGVEAMEAILDGSMKDSIKSELQEFIRQTAGIKGV